MSEVKCVVVGDTGVGKTTLIISHTTNAFAGDYVPVKLDNYSCNMMVDGKFVTMDLWDSGSDAIDRLRSTSYPGTDIFLICFTINRRETFNNVRLKWVPEIKYNCPDVPFIIVGTRIDIRHQQNVLKVISDQDLGPDSVSPEEGRKLAAELGAVKYLECSALTTVGQKSLFDEAVRVVLDPKNQKKLKRGPPPPLPPKPEPPVVSPMSFTDARFASLVNNKQFFDVTFRVQDRELYAHKVVLSTSSPMFQKVFVHNGDLPPMFMVIKTSTADPIAVEESNSNLKQEEHVTVEVKDFSYEAFLVVLTSCYTASAPSTEESSNSHVTEAVTFFQRYPRFTSDERNKFLMSLAESNTNNNNNNDNTVVPRFADVCIELPSTTRAFCHKAVLAAGSEYFRTQLTSNDNLLKVDLNDSEFSSVKRFLYNGTVSFEDKPFEYLKTILPKVVNMNLKEYVSHCVVHLCGSIQALEDKSDAHGYVLSVLTLAEQLELCQLRSYCIWWMQVNFDTINEQSWFKNEMTLGNREEVVRGQWPGPEYHQLYNEWKAVYGKKGKKKDKDCVVQ